MIFSISSAKKAETPIDEVTAGLAEHNAELHPVEMGAFELIRHAQRCDTLAQRFLEVVDAFAKKSENGDQVKLSALEIEKITNEILEEMR